VTGTKQIIGLDKCMPLLIEMRDQFLGLDCRESSQPRPHRPLRKNAAADLGSGLASGQCRATGRGCADQLAASAEHLIKSTSHLRRRALPAVSKPGNQSSITWHPASQRPRANSAFRHERSELPGEIHRTIPIALTSLLTGVDGGPINSSRLAAQSAQ
jgi:hypothetical protein